MHKQTEKPETSVEASGLKGVPMRTRRVCRSYWSAPSRNSSRNWVIV